jgi:hypothetical protein
MGTVLRFPAERVRGTLYPAHRPEPAAILILPVVRIERAPEPGLWVDDWTEHGPAAPSFEAAPSRAGTKRRRRRSPRS